MADLSATYELIGPDGTRAVFNDADDPDFIGYLSEVTGLDGPEVREAAEDRAGADGGVHGAFYAGRRPITLAGSIWPEPHTIRNLREDRIKRATNALRADAVLNYTPEGLDARQFRGRRSQPPRITGRRPKQFLIALIAAESELASPTESSVAIVAGLTVISGFDFPLEFPLDFDADATPAASTYVVNSGTAPAWPRFRIDGPITNPRLLNATSGKELDLTYTLAVDEFLELDSLAGTILLGGTTNRYSALQFPGSEWWPLEPGSNDVRLYADSYGSPAAATVYWNDAYL